MMMAKACGGPAAADNDDDSDVSKKKPKTPSPVDTAPERTQTRRVVDPANDHRGKPNRLDRPPYNAIVLLHAFAPGHQKSSQIGTGWLVGPRHVVTAGHVVMNAAKIRGWLAYDSATDKSAAYFESKSFSAHADYVDNASADHDIAIIKLADSIDDIDTLDTKSPSDALPRHIYSAGYPEDHGGLTMLEARGTPVGVNGNDLYHDIDTDDGQSGSPIWFGMGKTVTGVHAAGSSDAEPDLNYGIYLSNEIFDWITASTS
jgi:glutamyl endopeptidase